MSKIHKVAVIKFIGRYVDYDDYADNIVASIPAWEEVNDEEFKLLNEASHYAHQHNLSTGYQVIELLTLQDAAVIGSIRQYVQSVEVERKRIEHENIEKKRKAEERKLKKLTKDKMEREALFKHLKQEFETTDQ